MRKPKFGLYIEGTKFGQSRDFPYPDNSNPSFIWSRQEEFHPSNTQKKLLSLLHIGSAPLVECSTGTHVAQIRVKSEDNEEIVRPFILEVK